jgi:hypothetical protein
MLAGGIFDEASVIAHALSKLAEPMTNQAKFRRKHRPNVAKGTLRFRMREASAKKDTRVNFF